MRAFKGEMSRLEDGSIVREFGDLGVELERGSALLDRGELLADRHAEISNTLTCTRWRPRIALNQNLLPFPTSLSLPTSLPPAVHEVGVAEGLSAAELAAEWVAFAAQRSCQLEEETLEHWERHVREG